MNKNILERIPAVALTVSLVACSTPRTEFESMPEVQEIEVACVNVDGLPAFTPKTCGDLADRVEQAVGEFHDLAGGTVGPPRQVRPRLLPGTVQIDDARETRCINYTDATREEKNRLRNMVDIVTGAAMEQVEIDPSKTALVVAANASPSLCRKQLPPDFTERCPDADSKRAFLGGQALHDAVGEPVVFVFASPDEPELDLSLARHERGHLGIETEQLGHDLALCSSNSDQLPSRIDGDADNFGTNIRSWKGSIMGYSHYAPDVYIAPPHLAQLGIIEESRIVAPKESGTVMLSDVQPTGPIAIGDSPHVRPAALQLELNNSTIKKAIAAEVAKIKLSADDYVLQIAKLPGQDEVTVYATPPLEMLRELDENTVIFLIQRLSAGEQLDIADGPKIKVLSGNEGAVTLDIQLP